MTKWEVVSWGLGKRTYSVVKVVDGVREEPRARWGALSCIDAQVIAEELNRAHRLGRVEAIEAMRRQVFED